MCIVLLSKDSGSYSTKLQIERSCWPFIHPPSFLHYPLQAGVNKVLSHAHSLLVGFQRSNSICFHWYHTDALELAAWTGVQAFPGHGLVQGSRASAGFSELRTWPCRVVFGTAPAHHSVYLQYRRKRGLECSLAITKHNLSCTRNGLLAKLYKHGHTSYFRNRLPSSWTFMLVHLASL